MTRGPLPSRVYWFRRVMVLGTAVLLVVAVARLLGGGSDASDGDDAARLSADSPSSSSSTTPDVSGTPVLPSDSTSSTGTGRSGKPGKGRQTSEAPVLAEPTGPCAGSDIAVTPSIEHAVAGRDVMIVLELRTISAEACTWRVSPDALAVNITSGDDAIWSSRDCPHAITRQDVVVRNAVTTKVGLVWKQAKRSDDACSTTTGWAMPGWYHVTAAALGGEPSDLQFELVAPTAATVTVTATPKNQPSGKPGNKPSGKPGQSPSGAVEPDAVD